MPTVHIVSHTHWDREWYLPAGRFRQRLIALVDELLDQPPQNGASFLLDGQTSVLADYLDVKPERTEDLFALLRNGAIEAGPWFALADELIPDGESLIRNLFAGRHMVLMTPSGVRNPGIFKYFWKEAGTPTTFLKGQHGLLPSGGCPGFSVPFQAGAHLAIGFVSPQASGPFYPGPLGRSREEQSSL